MPKLTSNLQVGELTFESVKLHNKNVPVNKEHMNARFFFLIRTGLVIGMASALRRWVIALLDYK